MPTPTKPVIVLKSEKKSHRTKKELKQREQGEKALSSNIRWCGLYVVHECFNKGRDYGLVKRKLSKGAWICLWKTRKPFSRDSTMR